MVKQLLIVIILLAVASVLSCQIMDNFNRMSNNSQVAKTGNVGVGLGIPYGVLGLGVEFYATTRISVIGGLGFAVEGLGYDIGGRFYFKEISNATWRPRVTAVYGTNSVLVAEKETHYYYYDDYDTREDIYSGLTLGIGQQWAFGSNKHHSIDFDLMYIVTSAIYDDIDFLNDHGWEVSDPGRVKISLGYRYNF